MLTSGSVTLRYARAAFSTHPGPKFSELEQSVQRTQRLEPVQLCVRGKHWLGGQHSVDWIDWQHYVDRLGWEHSVDWQRRQHFEHRRRGRIAAARPPPHAANPAGLTH